MTMAVLVNKKVTLHLHSIYSVKYFAGGTSPKTNLFFIGSPIDAKKLGLAGLSKDKFWFLIIEEEFMQVKRNIDR